MKNYKLWLIEDNQDDIDLVRYAIRQQATTTSIELVVSESGEEAVEALLKLEPADLPALVLLDIKLPGIDGLEVLRRIRMNRDTDHLPVVLLTTSDSPEDIQRGYGLRANSYIKKHSELAAFCNLFQQIALLFIADSMELEQLSHHIPPRRP